MPRKKTMSVLIPEPIPDLVPGELNKPLTVENVLTGEPRIGDIIQVVTSGHALMAHIGIVHSGDEKAKELICYVPGYKGFPNQFRVGLKDVMVVGHARLKFKGETLPDPSRDRGSELDKI